MPRIISFGWTWPAVVAKKKTETRRNWKDDYATSFKEGEMIQAYDFSPRSGHGKFIAGIRIKSVTREDLCFMVEEDYIAEGFHFLDRHQQMIPDVKGSPIAQHKGERYPCRSFFDAWRQVPGMVWVVRFEILIVDKEALRSLGFLR